MTDTLRTKILTALDALCPVAFTTQLNPNISSVWLYVRVAINEGDALKKQQAELEAFAAKKGYQVIGVSSDTGSGIRNDRPGLNEVKAVATEGKIDALLVTNISRVSRRLDDTVALHTLLAQHDVDILALDLLEDAA